MLFPLLPFVFTQVQCGTVEKEQLASSLGSLWRVSGGFGEPSCWIAVRIELFLKFLFWAAGRRLPTLGRGRTWSSTLPRRPRPSPTSALAEKTPMKTLHLPHHLRLD